MTKLNNILTEMNDRSREVFQRVVEGYLQSGEPVGSRTLTRSLSENLSAATVRNVMQDLEYLGLLDSPHVSSGRIPTQMGLRMFVDGLLEVDGLAITDREKLDGTINENPKDISATLDKIGSALSGITQGASLVLSPKQESEIEHVEFVSLAHDRALVVLVFSNGHVENRLFQPPLGQTPSSLKEAANFLNSIMQGRTLSQAKEIIQKEISIRRQELDSLAAELVENGIVFWEAKGERQERLIVRGRANLLENEAEEEEPSTRSSAAQKSSARTQSSRAVAPARVSRRSDWISISFCFSFCCNFTIIIHKQTNMIHHWTLTLYNNSIGTQSSNCSKCMKIKYFFWCREMPVSYTHLRAHETREDRDLRLSVEKKKKGG